MVEKECVRTPHGYKNNCLTLTGRPQEDLKISMLPVSVTVPVMVKVPQMFSPWPWTFKSVPEVWNSSVIFSCVLVISGVDMVVGTGTGLFAERDDAREDQTYSNFQQKMGNSSSTSPADATKREGADVVTGI